MISPNNQSNYNTFDFNDYEPDYEDFERFDEEMY